jgi:tripartite-type tricarboxylate transporter receptor subunit TctC
MPGRAAAARYPAAAVTIVVPYAAGGGGDSFTRAVATEAQGLLGVKVFVENLTGGGATIGVGAVSRAKPDGYTLGFVSSSPVVVAPQIVRVPYDPARDLTYLARFAVSAYPLVVRSGDARFRSLADLLAWARANPGRLKWSTAGMNGAPYVATLAAFRKEGLRTAFIPMQGSTEVMAGLLGGTLDLGVVSDYAGPMAAGDLRALAEIGAERAPELPGVPSFGELGYPLAPSIFYGLIGPAGLPREVIARWDATMRAVTGAARFQKLAKRLHGRVAYLPHAAFQASVHEDIARTRRELAAAGLIAP